MAGRPQQYGALRRALNGVVDWMMGKKTVGRDATGNVYYSWFEGSGPNRVERREVQWSQAYMYYDPNDIPAEWRMWLRKLREEPPTEEELAQNATKQAAYRARVAALEEAERLRRLRQEAVGTSDVHAGSQPDMARFLQQMGGQPTRGSESAPSSPSGGQPGTSLGEAPGNQAASGRPPGGESFKPESLRPGA